MLKEMTAGLAHVALYKGGVLVTGNVTIARGIGEFPIDDKTARLIWVPAYVLDAEATAVRHAWYCLALRAKCADGARFDAGLFDAAVLAAGFKKMASTDAVRREVMTDTVTGTGHVLENLRDLILSGYSRRASIRDAVTIFSTTHSPLVSDGSALTAVRHGPRALLADILTQPICQHATDAAPYVILPLSSEGCATPGSLRVGDGKINMSVAAIYLREMSFLDIAHHVMNAGRRVLVEWNKANKVKVRGSGHEYRAFTFDKGGNLTALERESCGTSVYGYFSAKLGVNCIGLDLPLVDADFTGVLYWKREATATLFVEVCPDGGYPKKHKPNTNGKAARADTKIQTLQRTGALALIAPAYQEALADRLAAALKRRAEVLAVRAEEDAARTAHNIADAVGHALNAFAECHFWQLAPGAYYPPLDRAAVLQVEKTVALLTRVEPAAHRQILGGHATLGFDFREA